MNNLENSNTQQIRKVLIKKLSYALASNIFMELLLILTYIFISNFQFLSPVRTFTTFVSIATSGTTWLYILPYIAVMFVQIITLGKNYVVHPIYSATRVKRFLSVFSTHKILHLILYALVGLANSWLYLLLSDDEQSNFAKVCGAKLCLVEISFFILLFGFYIGLHYYFFDYKSNKNILFPVIQQKKWLQFKANLFQILQNSRRQAFWPTINFIVTHFLFGDLILQSVADYMNLSTLQTGLLSLYFSAYIFCTAIYFNLNLIGFFYELYLTQPVYFPIINVDHDFLALTEAINSNVRVIQHLGCLDLFQLSGQSKSRREILYTLSQPGGHPHTWNNLVQTLLKILREYSESINRSTASLLPTNDFVPKPAPVVEIVSPRNINYDKLRNMSLHCEVLNSTVASTSEQSNMGNVFVEKIDDIIKIVKDKTGITYLFRELPEVNIQRNLSDGQIIVWITQALSSLAVASLKEDRYGIVQKDLAVIISTIVELKLSFEKLNRVLGLNRKGDDFNGRMKLAIYNAVKRALYNICDAFGPYLKDLNLKKEMFGHLQGYINVRHDF